MDGGQKEENKKENVMGEMEGEIERKGWAEAETAGGQGREHHARPTGWGGRRGSRQLRGNGWPRGRARKARGRWGARVAKGEPQRREGEEGKRVEGQGRVGGKQGAREKRQIKEQEVNAGGRGVPPT